MQKTRRQISGTQASSIQEIKHKSHHAATTKHGNRAEDPEQEREREIEGSQSERPKEAAPIQFLGDIFDILVSPFWRRDINQETDMGIVSGALHIAEECYQKTYQHCKVLELVDCIACERRFA